ncbi:MFS transporter [Candidatus Woesearchaeota archaeon]|nr:MFS transporter [Candidatus Woesearchaeota archaeon]
MARKVKQNVIYMGLASLFTDISSEMIFPILPLFLVSILGANMAIVGLIEGIAEGTASILKTFSGWISDKLRKRKLFMIIGYGISALTKPFLALSYIWQHILGVRFFDRVGKGIREPPRDALIAASAAKKIRGKSFGIHRMMDTMGAIIGTLISFYLLSRFAASASTYKLIFWLAFIPAVIAVLIIIFFVKDVKKAVDKIKEFKLNFKLFNKNFKIFIFVTVLFNLGYFSYAFFILRAKDMGVAIALIPIIYLVYHIFNAVSNVPFGELSDKIGRKKVLSLGYIIFGLVCLGFAYAFDSIFVWLLFAAYGVAVAIVNTISRAFVSDMVPFYKRGTALGIYHTFAGFAVFLASFVAGNLWNLIDAKIAFLYATVLAITAGILLYLFVKEKVSK